MSHSPSTLQELRDRVAVHLQESSASKRPPALLWVCRSTGRKRALTTDADVSEAVANSGADGSLDLEVRDLFPSARSKPLLVTVPTQAITPPRCRTTVLGSGSEEVSEHRETPKILPWRRFGFDAFNANEASNHFSNDCPDTARKYEGCASPTPPSENPSLPRVKEVDCLNLQTEPPPFRPHSGIDRYGSPNPHRLYTALQEKLQCSPQLQTNGDNRTKAAPTHAPLHAAIHAPIHAPLHAPIHAPIRPTSATCRSYTKRPQLLESLGLGQKYDDFIDSVQKQKRDLQSVLQANEDFIHSQGYEKFTSTNQVMGSDVPKLRKLIAILQEMEDTAAERFLDEQVCASWCIENARRVLAEDGQATPQNVLKPRRGKMWQGPLVDFGQFSQLVCRLYPSGDADAKKGRSSVDFCMQTLPALGFYFSVEFGDALVVPRHFWPAGVRYCRVDMPWPLLEAVLTRRRAQNVIADGDLRGGVGLRLTLLEWHVKAQSQRSVCPTRGGSKQFSLD
eukprot:TRINITY_DN95060_c0_g1_i1.p1 TRINITY_DN95060_c0_g1~~TRINITY_DN95060_c0_g1_i1.p1  ORF type:complete len:507 (+),score=59.21 TRINITY_DN95060_c0_g1_i1:41-1561(+)